MELALITAQQVAVLFLLIGTGMVAVKTGVLKLENKQALSNLLVYIIVPAMVVNSYRMEFSAQILHNLLAAFGMSVLSVLLGTDGLSNYLKLEKLPELLKSCIRKGSLQELIDYANNRGGSDNITAVVLYRQ